jgi:hypothetical protein
MSKSTNGWTPLSYPSSCIFSSAGASSKTTKERCGGGVVLKNSHRIPNPYFPLHRDVLVAAMRELCLLDGKINPRTLKLRDGANCGADEKDFQVDTQDVSSGGIARDKAEVDIVPPENVSFRFSCAEELVEHMIHQAVQTRDGPISMKEEEKEVSSCELPVKSGTDEVKQTDSIQSKRKVSDVDESYLYATKRPRIETSFPSHLVELVKSNIIILQRTAAASTVDTESTTIQPTMQPSTSVSDSDLQAFLHHPQMQKQNSKPIMALPPLLQTSIYNEMHLRNMAHTMVSSILKKYNLDTPLQIFLGYKSIKCINRNKLITIFADVLFDVSHAMYAWIQTEKEMYGNSTARQVKGHRVQIPSRQSVDMNAVKEALFDDRALKRIGGFGSSSLLPLALGVRYCQLNNVSWEEYAQTDEGRRAMEIHFPNDVEKRRYNEVLFEVGKCRRGRRGRALRGSRANEASNIVG